jgi:hypothetical protein
MSKPTSSLESLLNDYPTERELAKQAGNVNQRTFKRARDEGHIRFFYWGGEVRDNRDDALKYLESRIQRRNQPRRARRQSRQQNQATA